MSSLFYLERRNSQRGRSRIFSIPLGVRLPRMCLRCSSESRPSHPRQAEHTLLMLSVASPIDPRGPPKTPVAKELCS